MLQLDGPNTYKPGDFKIPIRLISINCYSVFGQMTKHLPDLTTATYLYTDCGWDRTST